MTITAKDRQIYKNFTFIFVSYLYVMITSPVSHCLGICLTFHIVLINVNDLFSITSPTYIHWSR